MWLQVPIDGDASVSGLQAGMMAALCVLGGVDDRPRLGGLVYTNNDVIGTVVRISGCCRLVVQPEAGQGLFDSMRLRLPAVRPLPGPGISLEKLPLSEPLLGAWAQLLAVCTQPSPQLQAGPGGPGGPGVDAGLLRTQQLQLAALRASRVLFRHQTRLRRVLRAPTAPFLCAHPAHHADVLAEAGDCCDGDRAGVDAVGAEDPVRCPTCRPGAAASGGGLLLHALLAKAAQASPLKPHFSKQEIEVCMRCSRLS